MIVFVFHFIFLEALYDDYNGRFPKLPGAHNWQLCVFSFLSFVKFVRATELINLVFESFLFEIK